MTSFVVMASTYTSLLLLHAHALSSVEKSGFVFFGRVVGAFLSVPTGSDKSTCFQTLV